MVTEQISSDGTRKWLLRTGPGIEFETVYIPEKDRGTLCVSMPGRLHARLAASATPAPRNWCAT